MRLLEISMMERFCEITKLVALVTKLVASELLDLKNKFTKLESDLEISGNINNKLVEQVTRLERKWWENEQYSKGECIEISGIPQSIEQIDLERTLLNVFDNYRCFS